ncbi:Nn.00g070560.m01.CDS01, partial [Neocucurbitaria sp. VM-36]
MPDRSPLDKPGQYDSDGSDGSDESNYVPLSAEASKRNEDDLEKLEILQDKERELQK